MRLFISLILSLFILFLVCGDKSSKRSDSNDLLLLELFTSQGCYSCPPADDLLHQLDESNSDLITIAYHVDYWNHLGWKDQFSCSEYSQYQRNYARLLGDRVYTPQLIINGQYTTVGSREAKVRELIRKASESYTNSSVGLSIEKDKNNILVNYQLSGNLEKSHLVICLIDKHEKVNIKSGENGGKSLDYYQIVKARKVIDRVSEKGEVTFNLNNAILFEGYEVVGYLQDINTYKIKSVGKTDL